LWGQGREPDELAMVIRNEDSPVDYLLLHRGPNSAMSQHGKLKPEIFLNLQ
jgi:hypothetical protein